MKRDQLRYTLLQLLFRYGSTSRPEILQHLSIRPGTVFEEVNLLKKEGLILEPARTTKHTGRKAPMLFLNPDYLWFAGIDFQIKKTVGVITDFTGRILYTVQIPALARKSLSDCRNEVREILRLLRQETGEDWGKVAGIGFADPGLVNVGEGRSIRAVHIPGWEDAATGKWLETENKVPASVLPEGMVKTFMEFLVRGREIKGSLFHLGMNEGIGGGFINKDGECFTGDTNQAMEIGHIVIDPKGPLCQCGSRGCLEAIAGKRGILRKVYEMIQSGVDTVMELKEGQDFSLRAFGEWAKTDKAARIIANDVSRSIGHALAVVVSLLNPSTIVLSGELTSLKDLLMDPIKQVLMVCCFADAVKDLKIEFSRLEENDTARGVAMLMRNKLVFSGKIPLK